MSSELLERVKSATGPDEAIDRALFDALTNGVFEPANGALWESGRFKRSARPFTGSIDAALALAERVLPGWVLGVDPRHYDDGAVRYRAIFSRSHPERSQLDGSWVERTADEGSSPTIPLAIIAALLTARTPAPA